MSTVPLVDELVEVLLIEDSHADAEFILWALQERGLGRNVKVVQDGQAALDYLFRLGPYRNIRRSQLPRLVILEHRIPKRSCLDVLQAMKTDPDLKTVPVVVLSASEDEQDRDACLAGQAPVAPSNFARISIFPYKKANLFSVLTPPVRYLAVSWERSSLTTPLK